MATPKGMPAAAISNSAAAAASKKETELTKKAAATPLAKAPAAAISNAAATANSKAQSFDVKKADQNVKNAQQAATIVNQVAKQAPAVLPAPPKATVTSPAPPKTPSSAGAFLGEIAKPQYGVTPQAIKMISDQIVGTPSSTPVPVPASPVSPPTLTPKPTMDTFVKALTPSPTPYQVPTTLNTPSPTPFVTPNPVPTPTGSPGFSSVSNFTTTAPPIPFNVGASSSPPPPKPQPLGAQLGQAAKDVALSNPAQSAPVQSALRNLAEQTYGSPAKPSVGVFGQAVAAQQNANPASIVAPQLGYKPTPDNMNVYASGNTGQIQDYTRSNVAPMTEAEKQQAYVKAVETRADVLRDQGGTRLIPQSSTTLTNQAIQDVNKSLGMAQGLTSVSPSAEQPAATSMNKTATVTPTPTATTTPVTQPLGAQTGEQAKPTPVVEKKETPVVEKKAEAVAPVKKDEKPAVEKKVEAKTKEEMSDAFKKANTETEKKGTEQGSMQGGFTIPTNVPPGGKPDSLQGGFVIPTNVPPSGTQQGGTAPTTQAGTGAPQAGAGAGAGTTPQAEEGTTPVPEIDYEGSAIQQATEQVDKEIADQMAVIDQQLATAQRSLDTGRAEQLQAYRTALQEARDNNFQQYLQQQQQLASRGILNSGLAQDAQTRLQMSYNKVVGDLAGKQQIALQKLDNSFKDAFEKANAATAKLQSGRDSDISKIANSLIKENASIMNEATKADAELRKLQIEENKLMFNNMKGTLDRLRMQQVNTAPFEPYLLSGDVEGLARALQQSTNPELSVLGKQTLAQIEQTKSQITLNKQNAQRAAMQTKESLSRIDKQRSETTGFVHQNGVPVKENGKYVPTFEAKTEAQRQEQKRQEANLKRQEAKTKAASKTAAQVKAMTEQQQLNYVQDAVNLLYIPKYTTRGTPPFTQEVKVGETLDPAQKETFDSIMQDMYTTGRIDSNLIKNEYKRAGLPQPSWLPSSNLFDQINKASIPKA